MTGTILTTFVVEICTESDKLYQTLLFQTHAHLMSRKNNKKTLTISQKSCDEIIHGFGMDQG